jgi:hypothetical protein
MYEFWTIDFVLHGLIPMKETLFPSSKKYHFGRLMKKRKVQIIFLLVVLTLLLLSHILTWYGVTFLGLVEGDMSVARLLQMYGTPVGLFINYIIWLMLIIPLWFVWTRFPLPLKSRRKWSVALNSIFTFIFAYIFMWLFWVVFFDFANDAAMVSFRSKLFAPLLEYTAPAVLALSILALISAALYLKLGRNL